MSAGTLETSFATSVAVIGITDWPSISMSPLVSMCILLMHLIRVVFPHPLGPIRPTSFPDGRVKLTSLSAW